MDEKSLGGLLSQLIQSTGEQSASQGGPDNLLVESLKGIAGQSGGGLDSAVNEFLRGQGELHETTRAAVTRGGASAASDVAKMLTGQFNLPPVIANLVAPLLVKLLPSIGQTTGSATATAEKPKPRRKAKPKTSASTKPKESSSKTKPKKKPAAKPKTSTSKPATKKKTSSKTKR